MHYIYWKTWQSDLIDKAGANHKRDVMACNEAVGSLKAMRRCLVEEKAKALDIYIKQLEKITSEIKKGGIVYMRIGLLKQKLDRNKMRVMRNFDYKKVKDYIKTDKIGGKSEE